MRFARARYLGLRQSLFDSVPAALLQIAGSGEVMVANRRAEELFGYGPGELAGRRITETLPDWEEWTPSANGTVRRTGGRRRDGSGFAAELSAGVATGDLNGSIVALVCDAGVHQRVEGALRRSERRLAEAQRLARLGSWEWDVATGEVSWSDELFRVYGFEPGEIEPSYERFLELVHPDDRAAISTRNERALERCEPFEDVKRVLRADGTAFLVRTQGEVIVDEHGAPVKVVGVCEDVTAKRVAQEAQARLAAIVQSSTDAIVSRSLDGRITSWNPAAEHIYGYTADEAIGADITILVPANRSEEHEHDLERLLAGERVEHYETQRMRKDGSVIDVSLSISSIRDADGTLAGISTIARDITERKRFEAQLHRLANHDALTGLYNRRRFEEELEARVAHARRYGDTGALLVIDLDSFKYVNDAFGHGAGDQLLRDVATLLRSRLRETDVLARLGGDEFATLLPESDRARAWRVASELLETIRERAILVGGHTIRATASIGAVVYDADTASAEELLSEADRAMYEAKNAGRDRVVARTGGDRRARREARLSWEHRIREALDRDQFVLHGQPILDLRTNEVSRYELLLRMNSSDGETPPGAFLGVAERLGLSRAIDHWVVVQAIQLLAENPALDLEVNVSAHSVDDATLVDLVSAELARTHVDPARLIFEITETAAIANMDDARRLSRALTTIGCRFALDDFGTGFGSFYYLKHLPAEYLKIDGDFIRGPRSRTDELVVESIVRIARGLGKHTIAEFVEDGEALAAVRTQGVDLAQGFHIGRPRPVTELAAANGHEPFTVIGSANGAVSTRP